MAGYQTEELRAVPKVDMQARDEPQEVPRDNRQ